MKNFKNLEPAYVDDVSENCVIATLHFQFKLGVNDVPLFGQLNLLYFCTRASLKNRVCYELVLLLQQLHNRSGVDNSDRLKCCVGSLSSTSGRLEKNQRN